MNNLLIDESPLIVQPSLACNIGLNEAIVLQQIHYWLQRSKHVANGFHWTYNRVDQWKEQFPFWSLDTVGRILRSLRTKGVLIAEALNEQARDRTLFYRIDYETLNAIEDSNLQDCKLQDRIIEDGNLQDSEHGNLHASDMADSNIPNRTETSTEISLRLQASAVPAPALVPAKPESARTKPIPAEPAAKPKKAKAFDALAYLLAAGVGPQVASDCLAVRKARRAAPTLTAFEAIAREGAKAGLTFVQTVTHCAERGWAGFNPDWYEPRRPAGAQANVQRGGYMTQQERIEAANAEERRKRELRLAGSHPVVDVPGCSSLPMLGDGVMLDMGV